MVIIHPTTPPTHLHSTPLDDIKMQNGCILSNQQHLKNNQPNLCLQNTLSSFNNGHSVILLFSFALVFCILKNSNYERAWVLICILMLTLGVKIVLLRSNIIKFCIKLTHFSGQLSKYNLPSLLSLILQLLFFLS